MTGRRLPRRPVSQSIRFLITRISCRKEARIGLAKFMTIKLFGKSKAKEIAVHGSGANRRFAPCPVQLLGQGARGANNLRITPEDLRLLA